MNKIIKENYSGGFIIEINSVEYWVDGEYRHCLILEDDMFGLTADGLPMPEDRWCNYEVINTTGVENEL